MLDLAIVAGLGGFDIDEEDVFVPEDVPRPAGYDERMAEVVAAQRRFWTGL